MEEEGFAKANNHLNLCMLTSLSLRWTFSWMMILSSAKAMGHAYRRQFKACAIFWRYKDMTVITLDQDSHPLNCGWGSNFTRRG